MIKENKKNLWVQAIKWPLYSVAIIPIIISGAFNLYLHNNINILNFFSFVSASILILFWENLTNDLYDSQTGIDKFKFHSVVNLVKNKKIISLTAYLSLILGLFIVYLISRSTNFNIFILVLSCCILGYLYQGPPFRLGYFGFGEPLCWIAFGPLAHSAALIALDPNNIYYAQIPWEEALMLGSGPSLAITLVLFCSHFHQIKEDKSHGKNSPLVILGANRAASLIPWIILIIYAFQFFTILVGFIPPWCLLYFMSLPYSIKLIKTLNKYRENTDSLKSCKFIAIKIQTMNGIGLTIGMLYSFLQNK